MASTCCGTALTAAGAGPSLHRRTVARLDPRLQRQLHRHAHGLRPVRRDREEPVSFDRRWQDLGAGGCRGQPGSFPRFPWPGIGQRVLLPARPGATAKRLRYLFRSTDNGATGRRRSGSRSPGPRRWRWRPMVCSGSDFKAVSWRWIPAQSRGSPSGRGLAARSVPAVATQPPQPQPTPLPTPCASLVGPDVELARNFPQLGCPRGDEREVPIARQRFQRGR